MATGTEPRWPRELGLGLDRSRERLARACRHLDRLIAEAPRRDRERRASTAGSVLGWHHRRLATPPLRPEEEVAKRRALRPAR